MTDQRDGGIAWCDETWNVFRGCSRVSAGCQACYAEVQASRWMGPGLPYEGLVTIGEKGPRWSGVVRFVPSKLGEPIRWTRPRRIFTNSMSDMFHEDIPRSQIAAVLGAMMLASQHTFITLTKRPERMRDLLNGISEQEAMGALAQWGDDHVPELSDRRMKRVAEQMRAQGRDPGCPNPSGLAGNHPWMQWGVSVEDQKSANARIPILLSTQARVRIVSYEPALGPVDFDDWLYEKWSHPVGTKHGIDIDFSQKTITPPLDQIIVGGESEWPNGPRARPFDVQWAYDVIKQCEGTACAPFVKQMGSAPFDSQPSYVAGGLKSGRLDLRASKGDDKAEWPLDLRVQRYPEEPR